MTASPSRDRRGLFFGFALRVTGIAALVATAGWFLSPRWFAGEGAVAVAAVVGCAVSWVASLAGGLLLVGRPADPRTAAVRALAAMGLRLVAVAALVAAAGFGLGTSIRPLLLWTAISYVALLTVDTRFALVASGAIEAKAGSADQTEGTDGTGNAERGT